MPSAVPELNRAVALAIRDGPLARLQPVEGMLARGELLDHRLGFGRRAVVGADDVDALGRQVQRGAFAQATAGAGDQCD